MRRNNVYIAKADQIASTKGIDVAETGKVFSIGFLALLAFISGLIVKPANLFPFLKPFHLQELFAILAIMWAGYEYMVKKRKFSFSSVELLYFLFAISASFGLSVLYRYGLFDKGFLVYKDLLKTAVMLPLMGFYFSDEKRYKVAFLFFYIYVVSFYELHGIKSVIAGGGLAYGRFDSWLGQISNSDHIGAFMVMVLPVQLELALYFSSKFKKMSMYFMGLLSIALLVLTQTRSAFLSLIVVLPLWTIQKHKRGERFFAASLVVFVILVIGSTIAFQTEYNSYFDRMKSIFSVESYEEDSNINSRFIFWRQGLEIWREFPIFGCGVAGMDPHETVTNEENSGKSYTEGKSLSDYSLHQTFVQLLAETGLVGFFFYCSFLLALVSKLRKMSKQVEVKRFGEGDFLFVTARGMYLSLAAFVINAMFMTITTSWIIIVLAGFIAGKWKIFNKYRLQPN